MGFWGARGCSGESCSEEGSTSCWLGGGSPPFPEESRLPPLLPVFWRWGIAHWLLVNDCQGVRPRWGWGLVLDLDPHRCPGLVCQLLSHSCPQQHSAATGFGGTVRLCGTTQLARSFSVYLFSNSWPPCGVGAGEAGFNASRVPGPGGGGMRRYLKFGIQVPQWRGDGWLWGELGGATAARGLCSVLGASCSLEHTVWGERCQNPALE